jgi:capsular exopolysaccharide synthesis family protein
MSEVQSVVEEKEWNIKATVSRYFRYWYVFVIALALAMAGAWFYNWFTAPVYRVSCKLLIKDDATSGTRALLKELDVAASGKNLENEIQIMRSHQMIDRTLDQLEFDVSYFLVGNIKTSEVYLESPFKIEKDSIHHFAFFTPFFITILNAAEFEFHYELEGAAPFHSKGKFGEQLTCPLGQFTFIRRDHFNKALFNDPSYQKRNFKVVLHHRERLRNFYTNRLQVVPISPQSTIVEISMLDEVPQKGVDFLNTLVSTYLQHDINEKNRTADNTSVFIDTQLEIISTDLKDIESDRERFMSEKGIVDLSAESKIVLETARNIDSELAKNSARKTLIRYLKAYVADNKKLSELAPSSLDMNDPLLVSLIERLVRLETEKERLSVGSTVNNPQFVPVEAEIKLTRAMLLENITNIEKSIELSNDELQGELDKIKGRIQRIPKTERELIGIERQYRIQESLYLYLLEKKAEVSITLAASVSDNRVVDHARASAGPVKPVKSKTYAIALILGLIIPVVLVYFLELIDDTVRDIDTIERFTDIPLIGVVGHNKEQSNLVVTDKPQSAISEAYRSIRTNLKFFGIDGNNKVLLITSSVGTEGKTFSAMNLASVLSLGDKRVVLLGLDLRKPRIVDDFNLSNAHGMSTWLSGQDDLDDVIQPSKLVDGFDIIPSGPVPPNPSELIMSHRMEEIITKLSQKYDHIIIDSPPLGLVTDALILIKHAHLSLFVVRQGVTQRQHLKHLNQLYKQNRLGKIAIIFNAVKFGRGAGGYGYGYGYGYGAGSGHGYYQDAEVKTGWRKKIRSLFSRQ